LCDGARRRLEQRLATHTPNVAWPNRRQRLAHRTYERAQVTQTVARRHHGDDGDVQPLDVLLEGDVAVNREQDIEATSRRLKKGAILESGPPFLLGGADIVPAQLLLQLSG
jgi:hypothetical protein